MFLGLNLWYMYVAGRPALGRMPSGAVIFPNAHNFIVFYVFTTLSCKAVKDFLIQEISQ